MSAHDNVLGIFFCFSPTWKANEAGVGRGALECEMKPTSEVIVTLP